MIILDIQGKEKGNIDLPSQFKETVRKDLIKRAVEVIQANKRQPYGAKEGAGMRASGRISKRRHDYRTSYGHGISRVPRKIVSRRGTRMNWIGAIAPGTVGGRRAHPPKSDKIFTKSINTKERKKALRCALSASLDKKLVEVRGHIIPGAYPFIVNNDIEKIDKTKDVKKVLETLGFKEELGRTSKKTIRSGKGKLRGRKYRVKKGPLIIVGKDCKLLKSAVNILGVEIVKINNINCELLAPGAMPGRLTLFTESSIKELGEKKLFI
ncbi:50S ribosomal protein L4 [Candidatus Woesearchaeota archaeon B3_Woes]|nr:MAG: 50S ribosomal protein L4 [Candidatus Woesearchaeota archaeon B3_Woes]